MIQPSVTATESFIIVEICVVTDVIFPLAFFICPPFCSIVFR